MESFELLRPKFIFCSSLKIANLSGWLLSLLRLVDQLYIAVF